GEYIFDAVPPGLWVVSASADNQLGSYPSLIQLELGTAQEDINIKLLDGAAVQVLVSSELAASCAGGRLQISAEGMPAKTVATFEIVTEGTLYAEGLPPQALSAVLKCNGYSIIGSPPMHEIGYRWEPVLPEGVSVSGQVIDNDGEPAAGVAVWV